MKNVGYIVEIKEGKILIVTPDYNYYHLKYKDGMKIGSVVLFDKKEIIKYSVNRSRFVKIAAIIIVCISLSLFGYPLLKNNNSNLNAYAYVDIESEKRIEIIVNEDNNVLLREQNIKYEESVSIKEYFKELNKLLDDDQIANENDFIIVTVTPKDSSTQNRYIEILIDEINEGIKSSNISNKIQVYALTYNQRNEALKMNLSMSRMRLYELAEENNIDVSIDDIHNENINTLSQLIIKGYRKQNTNGENGNNNDDETENKKEFESTQEPKGENKNNFNGDKNNCNGDDDIYDDINDDINDGICDDIENNENNENKNNYDFKKGNRID